MPRYIDADEVKKAIEESWDGCLGSYDSNEIVVNDLWVIDKVPTADVVEVVRCKDCKNLVRSEGVCKVLSNNYEPPVYVEDDDFCSRGERRDDD